MRGSPVKNIILVRNRGNTRAPLFRNIVLKKKRHEKIERFNCFLAWLLWLLANNAPLKALGGAGSGMPGMQQGFVLDGDGSASSINMATLK